MKMLSSHIEIELRVDHFSIESLEEHTKKLPMRYDAGPQIEFDLQLNMLNMGNFWLWTTSSATGFTGSPQHDLDVWSLHVPQRGCYSRYNRTSEHHVLPSSAALLPFNDMKRMEVSPDFYNVSCTFDQMMLAECMAALDDERNPNSLHFEPVVSLQPDVMRPLTLALKLLAVQLRSGIRQEDLSAPLLREFIICHILAVWPQVKPMIAKPICGVSSASLRRAIDFIETNIAKPLTVADVAKASGSSVRVLQCLFRKEFGISPITFILNRRLDHIHTELCIATPGSMISQIAYRWGFLHMSDFARRYRMRFGCLPSDTYRRAQRDT